MLAQGTQQHCGSGAPHLHAGVVQQQCKPFQQHNYGCSGKVVVVRWLLKCFQHGDVPLQAGMKLCLQKWHHHPLTAIETSNSLYNPQVQPLPWDPKELTVLTQCMLTLCSRHTSHWHLITPVLQMVSGVCSIIQAAGCMVWNAV